MKKTDQVPKYVLKNEVKKLISTNQELKLKIMQSLQASESTLWRWTKYQTPQSTDYNLLLIVWLFIAENSELREKYSHIKNLENLLTVKK